MRPDVSVQILLGQLWPRMSKKYVALLRRSLIISGKPYRSNISHVRSWYATVDGILLPLILKEDNTESIRKNYRLYDSLTKTILE